MPLLILGVCADDDVRGTTRISIEAVSVSGARMIFSIGLVREASAADLLGINEINMYEHLMGINQRFTGVGSEIMLVRELAGAVKNKNK